MIEEEEYFNKDTQFNLDQEVATYNQHDSDYEPENIGPEIDALIAKNKIAVRELLQIEAGKID